MSASEPPPPSSVWRAQRLVETRLLPAARPFWFGENARPLFGWYHAPLGTPRAAVVLCNAFGHEAMIQHRTYRHLAETLARRGYAVLRFDYDGTGDSAGSGADPDRVGAWLGSIDQAVTALKALSGSKQVVLFGVRVGALLAAEYAARHAVDGLILMAPPRSGKAWLREMRALEATKSVQQTAHEAAAEDLGIGGHLLDEATRKALSALDPIKLEAQPAEQALLVARDDLPSIEVALTRHLSDLGVDVELCVASGYAASMPEDPFKAVVPTRVFESIVAWLSRYYPSEPASRRLEAVAAAPAPGGLPAEATPAPHTIEHLVDLGGLFGILTEPELPNARSNTAILLLNVGANHHIGSNRMYVHLARAWAAQGFRVLRLDFSGMGDSAPIPGGTENDVYAQRFMAEARRGIDFAQALGANRFILMGLCSGAYVSYHTAIADPRVTGIVMVNPLTFHWTEGDSLEVRLRHSFKSNEAYRRRFFQLETWQRVARGEVGVAAITGELARRTGRRAAREVKSFVANWRGEIAEATDIQRGFRRLCLRGTKCMLVFGAQDGGLDIIEEHLGHEAADMRGVDGFKLEVLEGPDHTFTPLWTQERLTELVTAYLLEQHERQGTG